MCVSQESADRYQLIQPQKTWMFMRMDHSSLLLKCLQWFQLYDDQKPVKILPKNAQKHAWTYQWLINLIAFWTRARGINPRSLAWAGVSLRPHHTDPISLGFRSGPFLSDLQANRSSPEATVVGAGVRHRAPATAAFPLTYLQKQTTRSKQRRQSLTYGKTGGRILPPWPHGSDSSRHVQPRECTVSRDFIQTLHVKIIWFFSLFEVP